MDAEVDRVVAAADDRAATPWVAWPFAVERIPPAGEGGIGVRGEAVMAERARMENSSNGRTSDW